MRSFATLRMSGRAGEAMGGSILLLLLSEAHLGEKVGENGGAFGFQNAARHLDRVVEKVRRGEFGRQTPPLLLIGAEVHPLDPAVQDRPHTHGAGLERDIDLRPLQPP